MPEILKATPTTKDAGRGNVKAATKPVTPMMRQYLEIKADEDKGSSG